jgi:hypothetical protein
LVELLGKAAGQACRARLPGKAAECMVKLDNPVEIGRKKELKSK